MHLDRNWLVLATPISSLPKFRSRSKFQPGPESKPGSEHRSSSVSQGRATLATRQLEFCRWWRGAQGGSEMMTDD